jgi:hypothetical protein
MRPPTATRLSLPVILAIIALILSALYVVGLFFDWPGWLRGDNWVWVRRVPQPDWRFIWMVLALLVGLALGRLALLDGDWTRRRTTVFLAALVVLAPLLQIAVAAQHRTQPLSVAVMSAAGFWYEGVRIEDPLRFAREHAVRMPGFGDVHLRTQPPGWPLAYWALTRAFERVPDLADVVGRRIHRFDCAAPQLIGLDSAQLAAGSLRIGLLLISGLGAPLLFATGRRFYSRRAARLAAVGFIYLPAMLVFSARFDVVFALLGLVMLWLVLKSVLDGSRGAAVLLAALVAAASFLSFTVLVLAGFSFLLGSACALESRNREPLRRLLATASLTGAVTVLFWGGLSLFLGVDALAMWRVSQEMHRLFRLEYPLWPLFNLYDLAVFMGIVPFFGALGAVFSAAKGWRGRRFPGGALAVGWVVVVVLLDMSGTVRAETGRLWLFLMPVGMMAGWSYFEDRFRVEGKNGDSTNREVIAGRSGMLWLMLLLTGFLTQALVTGYFLGGRAAEPATRPPEWRLPGNFTPLDYQLGEAIALRGFTVETPPGETRVTLYWQALDFPRAEYSVFVHALDAEGIIIAQNDGPPSSVPVWCWIPGEIVADERILDSPADTQSIGVGVYDPLTGVRLPVLPPVLDDRVLLSVGEE